MHHNRRNRTIHSLQKNAEKTGVDDNARTIELFFVLLQIHL